MSNIKNRLSKLESKVADGVFVCLAIYPGMTLEDAENKWMLENNATEIPTGGTKVIIRINGNRCISTVL